MKGCLSSSKYTGVKHREKNSLAIRGRLPPIQKLTKPFPVSQSLVPLPEDAVIHPNQTITTSLALDDTGWDTSKKISFWPYHANRDSSGQLVQCHPQGASKAPLALQLEAFIRKEHRQYLLDHPDGTALSTLHIFREGLSAFVEHFKEYKPVLSLIQERYDLTIKELTGKMKQMEIENLESKSDRSVHAMELMNLKESLNTTIRNQEAQLRATQSMAHSLREQLSLAEGSYVQLEFQMKQKLKGFEEAQKTITMLSNAMIEESSRTAEAMEACRKKDREMELLRSRVKVLSEQVNELKDCLRDQTRVHIELRRTLARSPDHIRSEKDVSLTLDNAISPAHCSPIPEYLHRLLVRIDTLEGELAMLRNSRPSEELVVYPEPPPSQASNVAGEPRNCCLGKIDFPIIQEWLRLEGIGEAELEASDTLLPPGLFESEEFAFLKACAPVRNRHLHSNVILKLIDDMWRARERHLNYTHFQTFFLEWLTAKSGGQTGIKELGINLLQGCQRNLHHPDCYVLLHILRGFLPEKLAHSCRQLLSTLWSMCQDSSALLNDEIPISQLYDFIRKVWPEKYHAHMLQLRFYAHRHSSPSRKLNINDLLSPNSYFVTLLKRQYFREVEEFTLRVVESVRVASDGANGMISVPIIIQTLVNLDNGLTTEHISSLLSEAFQKTTIDLHAPNTSFHVTHVIQLFRQNILLRRATPPD